MNIVDLKPNIKLTDALMAIDRLEIKPKKDGEQFFKFRFSDSTGKIDGVMWDGVKVLVGKINSGDVVKINGTVGEYNNIPQLTVRSLEKVENLPTDDLDKFLPPAPIPIEEMYTELQDLAATIKDPHIQRLLQLFWLDRKTQEAFKRAPAGKKWHHAYRGGLLHHTLCLFKLAVAIAPLYPKMNRDELLAGTLFHDIGKIEEYKIGATVDFTSKGRLLGHVQIGDRMLASYIDRLKDFPEETSLRLRHIILSHHGETGNAPVLPMTLEGIVFHALDLLDSQADAYTRELTQAETADSEWSDYQNLLNRFLFRGNRKML